MVEETLEYLSPPGISWVMVDATLGEGGHAEAFLNNHCDLFLIGVDADEGMLKEAKERLSVFSDRITYANSWFSDFFSDYLEDRKIPPEIILFDLGVSRYHYERSERGFSFSRDEKLDMRIDTTLNVTAQEIVNRFSARDLERVFSRLGEERYARRIARAIVTERDRHPIESSRELADIVVQAVPSSRGSKSRGSKSRGGRKKHPATQIFQALQQLPQ